MPPSYDPPKPTGMDQCLPPKLSMRPRQKARNISSNMQFRTHMVQICRKSSKVWTVHQMSTHQTKLSHTDGTITNIKDSKPTFSWTTMPGSADLTCHELIKISTINSKYNSTHHLLMEKAVIHSKWVSFYLPLKRWSAKEQLALRTFLQLFSSHSVLWPSRNYYPYSTQLFLLLIVQESGGLLSLFHYWKLGSLVKLHLSTPSVLHQVLLNFWKAFLLIVFIKSPKPKLCLVDSKPNFIKVGAAKLKIFGW